ncbi:MAG: polymer-forming cytoskeletal protein [Candidatus Baltobacteraceae bacterium]
MNVRLRIGLASLALIVLATVAPASAHTRSIDHGGTYFGDVIVERDQVVDGDVTVMFGDATIEGTVNGDVTDVGGTVDPRPGSVITGTVHGATSDSLHSVAPWLPFAGASALMEENARMIAALAYSVVILLFFLIFPVRVRVALERVERHPGLSAAVGVLAFVAIIPLALLLLVSIVGIPLVPLEFVALLAGIFIGQAALGLLVGRRLYELIRPQMTPSPLTALIIGLIVLSAAQIVPVVGHLVTALVWLVGLGAAILAFMRDSAFLGPGSAGRPPIGGPPMNPA